MPRKSTSGRVYAPDPVNRHHSLNRGLLAWYMPLSPMDGGFRWWDLYLGLPGTLTSMGNTANGWRAASPPNGFGSVQFDGSAGYVDCGNSTRFDAATDVTILCWLYKTTAPAAYNSVCSKKLFVPSNATNYELLFDNTAGANKATFQNVTSGTSRLYVSTFAPTVNAWQFIAAVASGTSSTVNIYGAGPTGTVANYLSTPLLTALATNAGAFQIGRAGDAAVQYFQGYIGDLRVHNRAMSAAEVLEYYNLSKLGYPGLLNRHRSTPPLVPSIPTPTSTPAAMLLTF